MKSTDYLRQTALALNILENFFLWNFNGQVKILEISELSKILEILFKSVKFVFSILASRQNQKLGDEKTRNNIFEISNVSEFLIFTLFHFLISFILFKYNF